MNPGTPAAKLLGCTCDELANNYGVGTVEGGRINFCVDLNCLCHGIYTWRQFPAVRTARPEEGTYIGGGLIAVKGP